MEIITLEYARQNELQFYFTNKPCKHGHISKRRTKNLHCIECEIKADLERKDNPSYKERKRANALKWHDENREYHKLKMKESYNSVDGKEKRKEYIEKNHETILLKDRERKLKNKDRNNNKSKEWRQNNRDKTIFYKAQRRSLKNNATPKWITDEQKEQIKKIYAEARRITEETGIPHHVDHIHPLRGKNFCGLNVHYNLQILTAEENMKKGNRL